MQLVEITSACGVDTPLHVRPTKAAALRACHFHAPQHSSRRRSSKFLLPAVLFTSNCRGRRACLHYSRTQHSMVLDRFQVPNAIPPRTSSTNTTVTASATTNGHHSHQHHHRPSNSMSKAVAEGDWIAPGKKGHKPSASVGGGAGSGPGGQDTLKHIDDELLHQSRSTWSADKEKVCSVVLAVLTQPD